MNALQEMIDHSRRVVFFGGAGVSVASGIPDFRGENGLYAREYDGLTAEMLLSHSFFFLHPDIFYDFYRKHMIYPQAKPNIVHRRLAQMEQAGKLTALVTQNIDGLHKQAGSRNVFDLHGSIYENFCMGCGRRFPLSFIMNTSGVPHCPDCGDVVRPEVTLYGEPPDPYFMTGACREISNCDMLIVAGTSLQVEPAASCLEYYRGKHLAVINREETPADARASLVLHEDIAQVFEKLNVR